MKTLHEKISSFLLAPLDAAIISKNQDDELLDSLIHQKIILSLDWSGGEEEDDRDLCQFIQARLLSFKSKFTLDTQIIYDSFLNSLERGAHILKLIELAEAQLKRKKFTLLNLDRGNDTYYLFIVPSARVREILNHRDDYWRFERISCPDDSEKTVELICDCGVISKWKLSKELPGPIREKCKACGKELFDEHGEPTVAFEEWRS